MQAWPDLHQSCAKRRQTKTRTRSWTVKALCCATGLICQIVLCSSKRLLENRRTCRHELAVYLAESRADKLLRAVRRPRIEDREAWLLLMGSYMIYVESKVDIAHYIGAHLGIGGCEVIP